VNEAEAMLLLALTHAEEAECDEGALARVAGVRSPSQLAPLLTKLVERGWFTTSTDEGQQRYAWCREGPMRSAWVRPYEMLGEGR